MREEQFKMERKGLVEEGQEVQVTERVNGSLYSYIVEPSVAMSGIYRSNQRIKSDKGIINQIKETERGFYLVVGFDVFAMGKIAETKEKNMLRLMKVFHHLMKIYDVEDYRTALRQMQDRQGW